MWLALLLLLFLCRPTFSIFSQSETTCKWHNVPPADGLDQFDWQIATGTVDQDLWLHQTGSDIQPSSPFLAAPSAKARPATDRAILISPPIACQSTTGTLTFDYWTSANTQPELLFCWRKRNQKELQDCQTLEKKSNPTTTVEIAPIGEEFEVFLKSSSNEKTV